MYIKSSKKGTHILIEVPQKDFRFWDTFCEFYIRKCEGLIDNTALDKAERQHFQTIKDTLEMILFTIDVNQTDYHTAIEFESTYLGLFLTMMQRWVHLLEQAIPIKRNQLLNTKNGENKRQLTDEIEYHTYLIEVNHRLINQFNTF